TVAGLRQSEVRLSGRSISPGLGMGRAWVVGDVLKCSGPPATIGQNDIDGELAGSHGHTRRRYSRLLKMGFRALSVAPTVIPTTKALIRNLSISGTTG